MRRLLLTGLFATVLCCTVSSRTAFAYTCGDINNDPLQQVTIQDIVYLVRFLFDGGASIPPPIDRANVDCSANPNPNITDLTYLVNYCFNGGSAPCAFCFYNAYQVHIESTHGVTMGSTQQLDVTLTGGLEQMGSFSLLISYDSLALKLTDVQPGTSMYTSGCGWEYFTYQTSSFGACGSACASSKVLVTGIADINNGNQHPSCFFPPSLPATLFTLNFFVTDDTTYECQFYPVRFVWFDCQDNTVTNREGNRLFLSRGIYTFDVFTNTADSTIPYPSFSGAHICSGTNPLTQHFIDFFDGGVDLICSDSLDVRGDVNLNGISYEIADALIFAHYFLSGLSVFEVNEFAQTAATDVNVDGQTLGVADLVYIWGVVWGVFHPFPSPVASKPPDMDATYTISNGQIAIDSTVAAAYVIVAGNVTPTSLADSSIAMNYQFDGTNTKILLFSTGNVSLYPFTFSGLFVDIGNAEVISAEFSTPLGGVVNATRVDGK